jgi:hypothetical protein
MKRYRLKLSLENATWIPTMIRTLFKVNPRWRTFNRELSETKLAEIVSAIMVAYPVLGIAVESVEEA